MENISKCPVCSKEQLSPSLKVKDHLVTEELFDLYSCDHCQVLITSPRPGEERISAYYDSPEYISHNKNSGSLINRLYKLVRTFTIKRKLNFIANYDGQKGKLLDYGCGTGDFLKEAGKKGWEPIGYEPSETAVSYARSAVGKNVFTDAAHLNYYDQLSAITMWHVLEHMHDLHASLNSFSKMLKPGGLLFIAVPNPYSWDASHYKEAWAAYDVPRHLYHFSKKSVKLLLEENQFSLIDVKPLTLDAFYISLLSEKYQTGSSSFIKAFVKGMRSNMKAKKHMNYSSLIYVARKDV